jgi:hypothetical protein
MQFGSGQGDIATDIVALRQRVRELEDCRRQVGRMQPWTTSPGKFGTWSPDSNIGKTQVGGTTTWHAHSLCWVQEKTKEKEGRVADASFRLN